MSSKKYLLLLLSVPSFSCTRKLMATKEENKNYINEWITSADKTSLFKEVKNAAQFNSPSNRYPVIEVDASKQYQSMDGFGFCLTDASAYLINKMSASERDKLLKELFAANDASIGISYIRVSIGASDLSRNVYSYDDVPGDTLLTRFSLDNEECKTTIAIIKQILSINPKVKILGSPWSAPAWMKDNGSTKGGSLKPEYYRTYAKYFVKYIRMMKDHGIHIDAVTPQNEPLNPDNNPSMYMTATEEKDFIKSNLGPMFEKANIDTKIWVYDHNCDHPEYATTILADVQAAQYIDGSAFHLYAGDITALTSVHNAYLDKNIYFSEQYTGTGTPFWEDISHAVKNLIIGASENWSKTVLEWNLASDTAASLHTPGGCNTCLGAVTVNGDNVARNQSYYIIAHASKFVRPGSYRIATNNVPDLDNVAFLTSNGEKVLIVLNNTTQSRNFNIKFNGRTAVCALNALSVATYIWR